MYALEEVAADASRLRAAFARGDGYRPLYVKLKLIHGCNLRCGMCNHWRDRRPAALSTGRLRALLDELAALGCRKVHFTGGEPTLRQDLEALVAHASAAGLRVTLTTNGTLLSRERARRLVEAGLRGVNVSIDSPVPAVHDGVRGVPGAWARAVEGAKNLRKEAHRGRLRLAINTVVTRLGYPTLEDMPGLALRLGACALRLLPVDEHTAEELRLLPAQIARYNADVAPRLAKRGLRAGLLRSEDEAYPFGRTPAALAEGTQGRYALGYYRERPCLAPHTHALVDHDGRVFACCMLRGAPVLGDLDRQSFAEVFRGEAYRRVRLAMQRPERLPACHRCDDFLEENRRLHRLLEEERQGAPARAPLEGHAP